MINFETPIQFDLAKVSGDITLSYTNIIEVSQGGPEVGTLSINNKIVEGHQFGGPALIWQNAIYAPVYSRSFLKSGFRLAVINSVNLKVEIIGNIKPIIFLNKIENGEVFFYEDMDKSSYNSYQINTD